ncbi:hypothetical protein ACH0CP_16710 [Sphingomonas sp. 179-I 2A4 NHS]
MLNEIEAVYELASFEATGLRQHRGRVVEAESGAAQIREVAATAMCNGDG